MKPPTWHSSRPTSAFPYTTLVRSPEAHEELYRDEGFLPEGRLNYVALLGWAIAADRDIFTLPEMVEAFEIGDVNPNPARFDLKKCGAINGSHMRQIGRAHA